MLISLLPEGPTMNFKLTNVKCSDEIKVSLLVLLVANLSRRSLTLFVRLMPEWRRLY